MKLSEILSEKNIISDLRSRGREEVISELLDPIMEEVSEPKTTLQKILLEREKQSPTVMNDWVAVPHGRIPRLDRFHLGVGRSKQGLDFGGENGPTKIFFLMVGPGDDTFNHLKLLARIARVCRSGSFKEDLLAARDAGEIYARIIMEDGRV